MTHARSKLAVITSLLLALSPATLVACSQPEATTPEPEPEAQTEPSSPESTADDQTPEATDEGPTMATYFREHYSSFDRFNQGIEEGTQLPVSMCLYIPNEYRSYLHDADAMAQMWKKLRDVHIDMNNQTDQKPDGEVIYFNFSFDGESLGYDFLSSSYAAFYGDVYFPVTDFDVVNSVVDEFKTLADAEEAKLAKGEVAQEGSSYLWDADGDGIRERVSFQFNGNGDEAPSTLTVKAESDSVDASCIIPRAYRVESVKQGRDGQGIYLSVSYYSGDHYSNDTLKTCLIRLVGDELKVTVDE